MRLAIELASMSDHLRPKVTRGRGAVSRTLHSSRKQVRSAIAVLAVLACLGCSGSGSEQTQSDVASRRIFGYSEKDLKPEAADLVDLDDDRDAVMVALWADHLATEDAVVGRRAAWRNTVEGELEMCLVDADLRPDQPIDTTVDVIVARWLESQDLRHVSQPIDESLENPVSEQEADVLWNDDAVQRCVPILEARSGYLEAGEFGQRRHDAIDSGAWIEDDGLSSKLSEAGSNYCPEADGDLVAECDRMADYMAAVVPLLRNDVDANWLNLIG